MRRFVDANTKLEHAIEYLHTRVDRPDAVLATGDLTNDGRPEQFRLLKALLEGLEVLIYLIPGNHDEREEFRSAFSDRPWIPASGPIDYVIDDFPVRPLAWTPASRVVTTARSMTGSLPGWTRPCHESQASRRFCSSTTPRF